ncbi:MAG: Rieske 2Fe-2S domain-containing protein [Chloroflexi bacterium]|nr:Rieske 2Fe-2S domain-containing protein [Chloroflexota bacterium]
MASLRSELQEVTTFGRRRVLKFLLGFSVISTLVGVLTPIIGYLIPPERGSAKGAGLVQVGTTKDIPIGQGKVVSLGNKPIIVTNTDHGVKAFSAICTHLGCIVVWDSTRRVIVCPCHDGLFNPVTGAVIAGPPPAPLPTMPVSVEGENIYVGEA